MRIQALGAKTSAKKSKALKEPKAKAKPIVIPSFPAKMAAAIERKRRQEKLSRTDYFTRLALKDLFKHDPQPKQPPNPSDGAD